MLRRLIVMRHAKSSWKSGAQSDHERPLNERGQRDAPRVARRLVELGWCPEHILSSDAERTRETCAGMLDELGEVPVELTREFYLAGLEEIRNALARVSATAGPVLVLGHNPGWEEAARWLSGQQVVLKTACAALLEREAATWTSALEPGAWALTELIRPRELP